MATGARTLTTLHEDILAVLEKPPPTFADELTDCCTRWATPDRVRDVVDSICGDEAALRACSSRSWRHPLGFDKFVVLATRDYAMRLHIWWPEPSASGAAEHIHNHRFSFSSSAITGRIRISTYEPTASGTLMALYREVNHLDERKAYVFDAPELVRIRERETWSVTAGSGYFLPADVLHRVSLNSRDLAATLVIKVPTDRLHTTVLLPPLTKPPATAQHDFFSPEETSALLRRFVDLLMA